MHDLGVALNMSNDTGKTSYSQDGLTRVALDANEDRQFRHQAWACSICALFLILGAAGMTFRHPNVQPAASSASQVIVPVTFDPVPFAPASEEVENAASSAQALEEDRSLSSFNVDPVALPAVHLNVTPAEALLSPNAAIKVQLPPAAAEETSPAFSPYQPEANAPTTPRPQYPALALRRGYEGKVAVEFAVTPSGAVTDVKLRSSSGHAVLDEEVLQTVRERWSFPPGQPRYHYFETVFKMK